MSQPLEGIRILDATHVLAGPFASYQLGLLGADVIRVEHPDGNDIVRNNDWDETRRKTQMGIGYLGLNSNKRSLALDLKTEAGRDAFKALAMTCDVVLENFRPGKMKALGLDAETLMALKPDLIYASLTGFGQSGPLVDRPAYDHIVQGMSGVMSVTGTPESGPVRAGFPLVDYLAGHMGAFTITAALFQRARTGKGEIVDVSMLDAALATMGTNITEWTVGERKPRRPGNKPYSGSPFSGCYDTKDGMIVVVGNTMPQAVALAKICGLEAVLNDPRVGKWQDHPELADELGAKFAEIFATKTALEWETELNAHSIPCGKVRDIPEVLDEPHVKARGVVQDIFVPALGKTVSVPGLGSMIGGEAGRVRTPPPELGEHSTETLIEAGYSVVQIDQMRTAGVIK